ncbi:hypothetical protein IGL98_003369 [Enterococcus sp. DIV0840]|uniref:replication initiation factor domain-containing protein n=1 Tax=unclassified Enterococcus TaxID=2608891 RepID=UPI001A8F993C|nr:replication initiation factor domain-containing protein [Enterococcus sp. DIV0849a]MBO0433115.1 replication initiation factor domain-containing protein [Enterococcus sp. DIV0849a]
MKRKQFLVDVDEFTLILILNESDIGQIWTKEANKIIAEFETLSRIPFLFGDRKESYNRISGYDTSYEYGENNFYFSISFHSAHPRMGIAVKFSATSWRYYRLWYNENLNDETDVYLFLSSIQSNLYETRLSRIDLTVDFINYDLDANEVYKTLTTEKVIIKNSKERKNNSKIGAIVVDNTASTIYIGSRGRNVKSLLRIYDKRLEQIQNWGIYHEIAINSESWIRFEMVVKGKYSHELTKAIMKIENEQDFKTLILSAITDRYRFLNAKTNELTFYSTEMISALSAKSFEFNTPSPRNNSLFSSINHIIKGSGLFPTLYKIQDIWGIDGLKDFWIFLDKCYTLYKPNDDVNIWLKKNKNDYLAQGTPFPSKTEKQEQKKS